MLDFSIKCCFLLAVRPFHLRKKSTTKGEVCVGVCVCVLASPRFVGSGAKIWVSHAKH